MVVLPSGKHTKNDGKAPSFGILSGTSWDFMAFTLW